MTVRVLRKAGDPVLRAQAKPVKEINQEILVLLDDMAESLVQFRGVGLAAPQVGASLAVVIIKLDEDFPLLELINPEIVECSGEDTDIEGCLSVPGIYGEVARCDRVAVRFQDRLGRKNTLRATGFLARAIQHEVDHLHGVLFTDKVINYVSEGE